ASFMRVLLVVGNDANDQNLLQWAPFYNAFRSSDLRCSSSSSAVGVSKGSKSSNLNLRKTGCCCAVTSEAAIRLRMYVLQHLRVFLLRIEWIEFNGRTEKPLKHWRGIDFLEFRSAGWALQRSRFGLARRHLSATTWIRTPIFAQRDAARSFSLL